MASSDPINDLDIITQQNAAKQTTISGRPVLPTTPQSSAMVGTDENGNPKVRRRWLVGDPWTDDYFFADWRTGTEAKDGTASSE